MDGKDQLMNHTFILRYLHTVRMNGLLFDVIPHKQLKAINVLRLAESLSFPMHDHNWIRRYALLQSALHAQTVVHRVVTVYRF